MVEHQPSKLIVRVRFPSPAPIGGIPERPKGADCKSAVADFDGSNPSPTTTFKFKTAATVAVFYHMRFPFSSLFSYLSHKSEHLLSSNWGELKDLQYNFPRIVFATAISSLLWHIAFGIYQAVHSSAWWRERGRIRFEPLGNVSPPSRRKPWLWLSTSSCAISSINHPARKRPFQFRHESPLRFAGDEQPSESGRFGQKSCRYGFICRESKLRWWQTWQFLILKESRCRPSVNPGYRECERIPFDLSKKRIADIEILCAR